MTTEPFADDLASCYNEALSYCRALCSSWSPSQAEDVFQSALLEAIEHYGELRDRDKFKPWLFQIITRTFYAATRRAFWKRFIPLGSAAEVERMPEIYFRPERQDEQGPLFDALSRLSKKQRAAILLFHVAGFSIEEIAAIQSERSLSTVKSRLSRARQKLRKDLRQLEQHDISRPYVSGSDEQTKRRYHETSTLPAEARKSS